jgi:hypothetical protein
MYQLLDLYIVVTVPSRDNHGLGIPAGLARGLPAGRVRV